MNPYLRHTLKQGDKIFFAIFTESREIEIKEAYVHEPLIDILTLQPDPATNKITGYLPYEWVGTNPLAAIRALRDRTLQKTIEASQQMKVLTEELAVSTRKAIEMESEVTH